MGDMTNGEFYTCPIYNYMIKDGLSVGAYKIDRSKMFGLGTPEDLSLFLKHKNFVSEDAP